MNYKSVTSILGIFILSLVFVSIISTNLYVPSLDSNNELLSPLDSMNYFLSDITSYAKVIDFFVFFVIFTTITLIGLKAMFKDKSTQRQITALAVTIGIMSSLALMFGGTFLGYEVSVFSLFPYALGFLIFTVIFFPIFLIFHFLMSKKHPVWAFFIALLITLLLYFLLIRPLRLGGLDFGGSRAGGTNPNPINIGNIFSRKGGNGTTKNGLGNQIKSIEKEIQTANKLISDGEKLFNEGKKDEAKKKGESASSHLESAKTKLNSIDKTGLKDSEANSINKLNDKITDLFTHTISLGAKPEVKSPCDEINAFTEEKFFSKIWDKDTNVYKEKGKEEIDRLNKLYTECKTLKDDKKIPEETFYTIAMNYHSALAKAWFKADKFDNALEQLKIVNTATGGTDINVENSMKRDEILRIWYEELIADDIIKLRRTPNIPVNNKKIIHQKLLDARKNKLNNKLINYQRP